MWSTIANFKENLNQIALEVQDAADELEIYRSGAGEDSSISDRRVSHRFAQSKSMLNSPTANGTDSTRKTEIDQYKAEIKRLQASEAEIKALSVNYAALLKEKEEQLSRMHEENGVLRKNLDVANVTPSASKSGTSNLSPIRQDGLTTRANNRSTGNHMNKSISRQDSLSNGSAHMNQSGGVKYKMETKSMNYQELADLLEDKNRLLATMQADHELQIKQLKVELNTEREISASIKLKSQEEQKLIETFQKELHMLKMDKEITTMEINELRNELNEKVLEIKRLQMELTRQANEEDTDETAGSLKRVIANLQKENYSLKTEKGELEVALKTSRKTSPDKIFPDDSVLSEKYGSDEANISGKFTGKDEMELSLQKLEKDFKEVCRERDKTLQELARLKQHLLDKELEESDKMDEDSKLIEELRANSEYQRSQILYLEKALKQAVTSQEEIRKVNSVELEKSKEMINELKQKLVNCMNTIDDKNIELLNLQTALGQYYAESEAKERLERDLVLTKEEAAKLSGLLKDANSRVELSKKEMEDTLAKLSQAERTISEGRHAVNKLEEDNTKLRRALEQSMTRLNRMSMDSDYFVDRRIVIKLLVTYFRRNHSKEVLDLMVRMLGFSEEDKQRIGLAQQGASRGVVRGVLGLPGRLVGGILGGGSPEDHASVPAENQSFADLWVDFLLKETEERERRESAEASGVSKANPHGNVPSTTGRAGSSMHDDGAIIPGSDSSFRRHNPSMNDGTRTVPPRGNLPQPEHSDSEFSTVPLTSSVSPSSENSSRISRLLPRY